MLQGVLAWACASRDPAGAGAGRVEPVPTGTGSMAPNLASDGARLMLSWLEPSDGTPGRTRLRLSWLEEGDWHAPVTIVEGKEFFANWADTPALWPSGDGSLIAHWLQKIGEAPYAYTVLLARSPDRGRTWSRIGPLPDDSSETEHGFPSMAPRLDGGLQAFWLDGRAMVEGGAMSLRTARLEETPGPSHVLDGRVCECCQTDAALTARGPVVVYRDRSPEEERDIHIIRLMPDGWSEPRPVHEDGWKIAGCPVNGPAIAAEEDGLAVAWFTAAGDRPRVLAAFSEDGGGTFGRPLVVDDEEPIGRVDTLLVKNGALVSWLAASGDGAAVRLRRVHSSGSLGAPLTVAMTRAARSSGFPRLARHAGELFVAWVDVESSRVRVSRVPYEE